MGGSFSIVLRPQGALLMNKKQDGRAFHRAPLHGTKLKNARRAPSAKTGGSTNSAPDLQARTAARQRSHGANAKLLECAYACAARAGSHLSLLL